jgi:hypothetical protein
LDLIVGGTVSINGSAGYEQQKRQNILDWPMQCLHVDAAKSVARRFGSRWQ